jgi:hypothetical protein
MGAHPGDFVLYRKGTTVKYKSGRMLEVNGKICRIYYSMRLQRPWPDRKRLYVAFAGVSKSAALADFLVYIAEIREDETEVNALWVVPSRIVLEAKFSIESKLSVPLTEKIGNGTPYYVDWESYRGEKGLVLLKTRETN